jgi:hypothetical protein
MMRIVRASATRQPISIAATGSALVHERRAQDPETEASTRAVPLEARALDALDRINSNGSPLLFPGERGGYLDIHHFRPYQWQPPQTDQPGESYRPLSARPDERQYPFVA